MELINQRYEILNEVSEGQFGVIYRARDLKYGKINAVKIFNTDKIDKKNLEFFKDEFLKLKSIDLPCVIKPIDYFKIWNINNSEFGGNYFFYTMEFLEGSSLRDYEFKSSEEKKEIFKKILFYLKYLHSNNISHGDLSDSNIFINNNKQIVFIDLMYYGNINEDIEQYKKLTDKYNINLKYNTDAHINDHEFFKYFNKRWIPSIFYNNKLKTDILNKINSINKTGSKSSVINFKNFDYDYFNLNKDYLETIYQINNYRIINVELSQKPFSFIFEIAKYLKNCFFYRDIYKNNKKEIDNIVENKIYDDKSKSFRIIKGIIKKLLEEICFKKQVVIICEKYDHIDEESRNLLKFINMKLKTSNLTFIVNSKTDLDVNIEDTYFNYYNIKINPTDNKYIKGNLKKLQNLFFHKNINNIINVLNKENYSDIFTVINHIKNYSQRNKNKEDINLNKISIQKIVYSKNYFIESHFNNDYKKIFAYISLLNHPVNVNFLKKLFDKNIDNTINYLINNNILKYYEKNKIGFKNIKLIEFVQKKIKKKSDFSDILNKIIVFYDQNTNKLKYNDYISFLKILFYAEKYGKLSNVLWYRFLNNPDFNSLMYREALKNNLIDIYNNLSEDKNKYSSRFLIILYLGLSAYVYRNDKEKIEKILLKAESIKIKNTKLKFRIYASLLGFYFDNNKYNIVEKYFKKINKLKDKLDEEDKILYYEREYLYYRTQKKYKLSSEKLKKLIKKIYKKIDTYPNLYLRSLNMLAINYNNLNKYKRSINIFKTMVKKAKKLNNSFYVYMGTNNIGHNYYYQGNKNKARTYFKKAVDYSLDTYIDDFIVTAYNNYGLTANIYKDNKKYLLNGLEIAKKNDFNNIRLLILFNLSRYLSIDEFYKLMQNSFEIIQNNFSTAYDFLRVYFLFLSIAIPSMYKMNDEKLLKKYYNFYKKKKEKITKEIKTRGFIDLIDILFKRYLNNFNKNDFFRKLLNASKNVQKDLLIHFVETIIDNFIFLFKREEKLKLINVLLENYNSDEKPEEYYNLKIHKLIIEQNKNFDINQISNLMLKSYNMSYTNYLTYMNIAKELKNKNKPRYKKLLSIILEKLNTEQKTCKNDEYFKVSYWNNIFSILNENFDINLINSKIEVMKKNNVNIINKFEEIYYMNLKNNSYLYKNILNFIIDQTSHDRAVLFLRENDEFVKKNSAYSFKFLYKRDYNLYYDETIDNIESDIKKVDCTIESDRIIKEYVIVPLLDYNIYQRVAYEKGSKFSRSSSSSLPARKRDYLLGFIYLDKKNNTVYEGEDIALKLIKIFLSENIKRNKEENKFMRDPLTKLYLRSIFMKKIREIVYEEGNKKSDKLSILMMDIDDFKEVNDIYGHQKGDEILKSVGRIIINSLRTVDIAARYGGEEFIIALPDTGLEGAKIVANRILNKVKESKLMGNFRELTLSCGISIYPDDSRWFEEIIKRADSNLYKAKENGKDQFVYEIN